MAARRTSLTPTSRRASLTSPDGSSISSPLGVRPTRHGSVGSGILQFMNLGHEVQELGPSSTSKAGRRARMIDAIKRNLHDPHSKLRYEETHDHEDWDFRVVHVHKFFYDEQSKKKGLTRRDWSKFGVVMKDNNACEEAKWDEHLSWEYQPEDPVWKIHVVETVRNDEDPERDTWHDDERPTAKPGQVEENWGDDTILMVTGDIDDTKVVTNTDNYFGDWTD